MNDKGLAFIYNSIIAPWGVGFDLTITPLFYMGASVGSEFLTYNVDKLYLCKNLYANGPGTAWVVGSTATAVIYDELNNVSLAGVRNFAAYYDTAANNYYATTLPIELKDLYFSRIVASGYQSFNFIGYRITRV